MLSKLLIGATQDPYLWLQRKRSKWLLIMVLIALLLAAGAKQAKWAFKGIISVASLEGLAGDSLNFLRAQGLAEQFLLVEGIPWVGSVNDAVVQEGRTRLLTWSFYTLTCVDLTEPKTFFSGQLPVAAKELHSSFNPGDPEQEGPVLELSQPEPSLTPDNSVKPSGSALVGIYSTHNSESYIGDGGSDHLQGNGEISEVATGLAQALRSKGIVVTQSDKVHDRPVLERAYSQSVITAAQMVKDNPKLQALLDVHRDGVPIGKSKRVVMVNGQAAAPVMIVLAEKHSGWEQNNAFATQLVSMGNRLYPGLFLPIYYAADARYNQHLHPHALLLEFGDQYNTTAEAIKSAQAVAAVLAKIIN